MFNGRKLLVSAESRAANHEPPALEPIAMPSGTSTYTAADWRTPLYWAPRDQQLSLPIPPTRQK